MPERIPHEKALEYRTRTLVALVPALAFTIALRGTAAQKSVRPVLNSPAVAASVDWPVYGGSSSEMHYSPLDQINASTVRTLDLAWFHDLPVVISAVAEPVVSDGMLYAAFGLSQIHALDGVSGRLLWRFDSEVGARKNLKLLLAANKRLHTAYLLKESFGQLWDYTSETWAQKFFENWRAQLKWQRLKPYEKFADMIERHWDGIAAYCKPENKVALGFVEGLNNKIRVIQRRAYGLRDQEYLRLNVLTCTLPVL